MTRLDTLPVRDFGLILSVTLRAHLGKALETGNAFFSCIGTVQFHPMKAIAIAYACRYLGANIVYVLVCL